MKTTTRDELDTHYRRYIASLNERRIEEAEAFYADELLYNGEQISRAEWRRTAIEDSFAAVPDLQWHIERLVIEGRNLAARLRDTGQLQRMFRGVEPAGQPTSFAENVFYVFRADGLIDEVWSVVDLAGMASVREA